LTEDGQNFDPRGGVTAAKPLGSKSYHLAHLGSFGPFDSRPSSYQITRPQLILFRLTPRLPHVLLPFAPHLIALYPFSSQRSLHPRPRRPASTRADDIQEALVLTHPNLVALFLPFIQQLHSFFVPPRLRLYHHPRPSNPRARVPGLDGLDLAALSVSDTGALDFSFLFLTVLTFSIVLLVCRVVVLRAIVRPRCYESRLCYFTYASCPAPRVDHASMFVDSPSPTDFFSYFFPTSILPLTNRDFNVSRFVRPRYKSRRYIRMRVATQYDHRFSPPLSLIVCFRGLRRFRV
jgi:hypothetical protein